MNEARWREKTAHGKIVCRLCPRGCVIQEDSPGFCGARKNIAGSLHSLAYGRPAAIALDPIEKKPLYHFYPGASTISLGTLGCNMRCPHCQNASLSFAAPEDFLSIPLRQPETIADEAIKNGSRIISWTYNEPLVWAEYVLESARAAREKGISSVLVTAGLANPEPWAELLPVLDACCLDIKGWGDGLYKKLTGFPGFEYVLQNAVSAFDSGCHLEIVTNLMSGWNDDDASLLAIAEWIGTRLSPDVPWHITASRPAHRLMDLAPTPPGTIERAAALGRKAGLRHVYGGNIHNKKLQETLCPQCAAALIRREGFLVRENLITQNGRCPHCETEIYGRF